MDESTIWKAVSEDFGLHSYVCVPRHLLTEQMKAKQLTRCQKLLTFLKGNGSTVKIFSDKKIFTVDQVYNRRNDRWIGESPEEVQGIFRMKHPQQVMVLGVLTSDGRRMPPYFFGPGEKVNKGHLLPGPQVHSFAMDQCKLP